MNEIKPLDVDSKIITLRNQKVIIDCDVAALYGVETKEVNQAVGNNPDKFPTGYIFQLQSTEKQELVKIFDQFKNQKHSSASPKAFTEKGLYMLATILKSKRATETTISIVEAFTKLRELNQTLAFMQQNTDETVIEGYLKRTGELLNELVFNNIKKTSSESTAELNLGVIKVKHTHKREKEESKFEEELEKIKAFMEELISENEQLRRAATQQKSF